MGLYCRVGAGVVLPLLSKQRPTLLRRRWPAAGEWAGGAEVMEEDEPPAPAQVGRPGAGCKGLFWAQPGRQAGAHCAALAGAH